MCGGGRFVRSRLVGKVSLSEKVVLVLPAIEAGAIKAGSRSCYHSVYHQGGVIKACAITAGLIAGTSGDNGKVLEAAGSSGGSGKVRRRW
jgi:hypothetical protein